jgi:DNA-binding NtrC family response regulator
MINEYRPSWVILDIFLADQSMGTELAAYLIQKNIGYIYISGSTDAAVIGRVKLTEPYGFLVKPFRENDLLIMLDIASRKHTQKLQVAAQRAVAWQRQLELLVKGSTPLYESLPLVPGFFHTIVDFDLMRISSQTPGGYLKHAGLFWRTDYGIYEMQAMDREPLMESSGAETAHSAAPQAVIEMPVLPREQWEVQLMEQHGFCSRMLWQTTGNGGVCLSVCFYNKDALAYTNLQLAAFEQARAQLKAFLEGLIAMQTPGITPAAVHMPAGGEKRQEGDKHLFRDIVGKSPALLRVLDKINIVAAATSSVLITGESGTGKEGVAKAIHRLSHRKAKPMVVVNCGALPASLIESELFGHEKGAFTGAYEKRIGKFQLADGGTIFLDEIGELPLEAQSKLLRVLQEKEIEKIGSNKTLKVDVRIIVATNRNLTEAVAKGLFRLDLFYRLHVFPVELPPLRERMEDVPLLTAHFAKQFAVKMGKPVPVISDKVLHTLMQYNWPGNIRELEHVVERNMLMLNGPVLTEVMLPELLDAAQVYPQQVVQPAAKKLTENEADHIISVLKSCKGKIRGAGGAAEILGLPPSTLHFRMKKLGIKKSFYWEE